MAKLFTLGTKQALFPDRVLCPWLPARPAPMSVYNGILRSYFLLGTKINFASNNDEKIVDHITCFHAITSRQRKRISASCRYQQNLEQNYLVIP